MWIYDDETLWLDYKGSTLTDTNGYFTFGPDGSHSETPDLTWKDDVLMALDGWGPPLQPFELSGEDGIPGTADDPFGDGYSDPPGSSILFLPTTLRLTNVAGPGPDGVWGTPDDYMDVFFEGPFPQVMTTASAFNIVDEPDSVLDGVNSSVVGEPWEFLAGLDHPGQQVPYNHSKWNAYVTYVCAWSVLEHPTDYGLLDLFLEVKEKKVRDDLVIADIDCNELVDIVDVVIAANAFGAHDEGLVGSDLYQNADPNFDARGDVKDTRGLIDIVDTVRISNDFGKQIEP